MNDIDYKEISHRYSDLWLSAFNELLDYYLSKSEESDVCPLCKLATHVVFEGYQEAKKNITENELTKPILMYSTSKVQN